MSSKLLRITQLNAVYLDKEILKIFQDIIQTTLKSLPPGFTSLYQPEISLFLRVIILHYSVYKGGNTFGQQLLLIKYKNFSKYQRILYILLHCLEYIPQKIEFWKPSHQINDVFTKLSMVINFLEFINFSIFLKTGRKPCLLDRLLGLDLVYSENAVPRTYGSKFLAREVMWNTFIEIVVNVIPLINFHKAARIFAQYNPFRKPFLNKQVHKISMTVHSICAYCNLNPINPYHMGCSHVFCYICLKGCLTADPQRPAPLL